MPWQRNVADVAGELVPVEGGGWRPKYPTCIWLVPRRAGKTLLTLATSLQRATTRPDARCWYTAQTGSDAGETFVEDWLPIVENAPDAGLRRVHARLTNGSQRFILPRGQGGRVGVFPPTETALHGKPGDYVTVDEAWALDELEGEQLVESAIRPTMWTRPLAQLVIVSAGGTDASTYLRKLRELGRQLVDEDRCAEAGVAYVEFYPPVRRVDGQYQLDADLDDPQTWADTHPAVGQTIDLDVLRRDRAAATSPAAFHRSTLNVFSTGAVDQLLPPDAWAEVSTSDAVELPARGIGVGYAVSLDRSHGAVAVCWRLPDGSPYGELVEYAPNPSRWMADRLVELRRRYRAQLRADSRGPVTSVTAELRRRRVPVETLSTDQYATACAELYDDVVERRAVIYGSPQLDRAAAGVARRELGDAWAWSQKRSDVDVSPLVALTVGMPRARQAVPAGPVSDRLRFAAAS